MFQKNMRFLCKRLLFFGIFFVCVGGFFPLVAQAAVTVDLVATSDSGSSDSDNITDGVKSLSISGATASASVTVTATDTTGTKTPVEETVTADASGNATITSSEFYLTEGVWSVVADDGTNTSAPLVVTVDFSSVTGSIAISDTLATLTASDTSSLTASDTSSGVDDTLSRYTFVSTNACEAETFGHNFLSKPLYPSGGVQLTHSHSTQFLCIRVVDVAGNVGFIVSDEIDISRVVRDFSGLYDSSTKEFSLSVSETELVCSSPDLFERYARPYRYPPTVYFSGGGLRSATAQAVIDPGIVDSITVTASGSGCTAAPTVAFSGGGGGSGATATAVVASGEVTSVDVTNSGSGYISVPDVVFSGGSCTGVEATAVIVKDVLGIVSVTDGGSAGYTSAPSVSFVGGHLHASATPTVSSGQITAMQVTRIGSGYTSAPDVTITDPTGTGAVATTSLANGGVIAVTIGARGSGYSSSPTVVFSGGGLEHATATATINSGKRVNSVTITSPGSGYDSAPDVVFSGGGLGPAIARAVLRNGLIESIVIQNSGSGYTSAPNVTLIGGGDGTAEAVITGSGVSAVRVTNPGSSSGSGHQLHIPEGSTLTCDFTHISDDAATYLSTIFIASDEDNDSVNTALGSGGVVSDNADAVTRNIDAYIVNSDSADGLPAAFSSAATLPYAVFSHLPFETISNLGTDTISSLEGQHLGDISADVASLQIEVTDDATEEGEPSSFVVGVQNALNTSLVSDAVVDRRGFQLHIQDNDDSPYFPESPYSFKPSYRIDKDDVYIILPQAEGGDGRLTYALEVRHWGQNDGGKGPHGLPLGLTFNPATHIISGIITERPSGRYVIDWTVEDEFGNDDDDIDFQFWATGGGSAIEAPPFAREATNIDDLILYSDIARLPLLLSWDDHPDDEGIPLPNYGGTGSVDITGYQYRINDRSPWLPVAEHGQDTLLLIPTASLAIPGGSPFSCTGQPDECSVVSCKQTGTGGAGSYLSAPDSDPDKEDCLAVPGRRYAIIDAAPAGSVVEPWLRAVYNIVGGSNPRTDVVGRPSKAVRSVSLNTSAEEDGVHVAWTSPFDVRAYSSVPEVAFLGGLPRARANATVHYTVGSVLIDTGGSNCTAAPTVTFSGGGGSGATATVEVGAGRVSNISVTSGGSGYTSVPTVTFLGGGASCTGVEATAVLSSTGSIGAIGTDYSGEGYTSAPSVSFVGGHLHPSATPTVAGGSITAIEVAEAGSGYTSAPTVTITDSTGTGATATATVDSNGGVTTVSIGAGGSGYSSSPTVVFSGGGRDHATATAVMTGDEVASITVVTSGSGYASAPDVVFSGGGVEHAQATVTLTTVGTISSVTVDSSGSGYTSVPGVRFVGDGSSPAVDVVFQGGEVSAVNVLPSYQIRIAKGTSEIAVASNPWTDIPSADLLTKNYRIQYRSAEGCTQSTSIIRVTEGICPGTFYTIQLRSVIGLRNYEYPVTTSFFVVEPSVAVEHDIAHVSWDNPQTGNGPISGYQYHAGLNVGWHDIELSDLTESTLTWVTDRLDPGKAYVSHIRPVSNDSNIAFGSQEIEFALLGLRAATGLDIAELSWHSPFVNNSLPLYSYYCPGGGECVPHDTGESKSIAGGSWEYRQDDGDWTSIVGSDLSTESYRVRRLVPGRVTTFQVRFVTDGGTIYVSDVVPVVRGLVSNTEGRNSSEYGIDLFGSAVSLTSDGETLLVGELGYKDQTGGIAIFDRNDDAIWKRTGTLSTDTNIFEGDPGLAENALLGSALALSLDDSSLFVGMPGTTDGTGMVRILTKTDPGLLAVTGHRWYHSQATATATRTYESVSSVSVPPGQGGFHTAPTVLFLDGGVDSARAAANAVIDVNGTLTSITVTTGGGSYENDPRVVLKGGDRNMVLPPTGSAVGDAFGSAISLSGNTLFVGAPGVDTTYSNSGAVHIYTKQGTVWRFDSTIDATDVTDLALGDGFGTAIVVSSDGNTLFVGAPGDDGSTPNSDAGIVYVLEKGVDSWSVVETMAPSPFLLPFPSPPSLPGIPGFPGFPGFPSLGAGTVTPPPTGFGSALALHNDGVLFIGAHEINTSAGKVILYTKSNGVWSTSPLHGITPFNYGLSPRFGSALGLNDNTFFVGARSYKPEPYSIAPVGGVSLVDLTADSTPDKPFSRVLRFINDEPVADQSYTAGTAITPLVLPEARIALGGPAEIVYTIEHLSEGLAFDATTRSITGTPEHSDLSNVIYSAKTADGKNVIFISFEILVSSSVTFSDGTVGTVRVTAVARTGALAYGSTITLTEQGGISAISVPINPGFGYHISAPPTVRLVGGTGSGATATATVANPPSAIEDLDYASATVTAVTVTAAGSGYTATDLPRVEFVGGISRDGRHIRTLGTPVTLTILSSVALPALVAKFGYRVGRYTDLTCGEGTLVDSFYRYRCTTLTLGSGLIKHGSPYLPFKLEISNSAVTTEAPAQVLTGDTSVIYDDTPPYFTSDEITLSSEHEIGSVPLFGPSAPLKVSVSTYDGETRVKDVRFELHVTTLPHDSSSTETPASDDGSGRAEAVVFNTGSRIFNAVFPARASYAAENTILSLIRATATDESGLTSSISKTISTPILYDGNAPTIESATIESATGSVTINLKVVHNQDSSLPDHTETLFPRLAGDCADAVGDYASPTWSSSTPKDLVSQDYVLELLIPGGEYTSCMISVSDMVGNSSSFASFPSFTVDEAAIALTPFPSTPAQTRATTPTVAGTPSSAPASLLWALIDKSATCDGSVSFPLGNTYTSGTEVTVSSSEADNDTKKACFKAVIEGAVTVYTASETITGVDTTPPSKPVISLESVADSFTDVDGDSAYTPGVDHGSDSDGVTNITNTTFFVEQVEPNSTLNFTRVAASNGASEGRSAVNGSSSSFSFPYYVSDEDTYTFTATQIDEAGNVSTVSDSVVVVLDETSPFTTPTIDLASTSDTGVSNTDNYTNAAVAVLTIGSLTEDDLYVVLQKNGTLLSAAGARDTNANNTTLDLTYTNTDFDESDTSLSVELYDLAGNSASSSTSLTIYPDYTVANPTLAREQAKDFGASNSDSITHSGQLGFVVGAIEVGATNRGNGAEVSVYDDTDPATPANGTRIPMVAEIGHANALVSSNSGTVETSKTDFSSGAHSFYVCQTDDAGNRQCSSLPLSWIVDTVAPEKPGTPDLHREDDSRGLNQNGARSGTPDDNITKYQYELDFASRASGTNFHTDQAHDQHQIRFYRWVDANTDDVADDSELTQLAQPSGTGTDNVVGDSTIVPLADAGYEANGDRGSASQLYPADDGDAQTHEELAEGVHTFVARQYDVAGNLSSVSDPLTVTVDITPPSALTGTPTLHPSSDSGTSDSDNETSNARPLFILPSGSFSDDVDYFELWRVALDSQQMPSGSYAYPSDSSAAEQTSYEHLDSASSPGDSDQNLVAELGDTYDAGGYRTGASVKVNAMSIPTFNAWYGFKFYAVDLAGNVKAGANSASIKILVPPLTPAQMDLASGSDSGRTGFTDGTTDNVTNLTSWEFSGSYKNASTKEKSDNAATSVSRVVVTVEKLDENDRFVESRTHAFLRATDTDSTNDIVVPANVDSTGKHDAYTYSFTFDAATEFAAGLTDGTYNIYAIAYNAAGESGSSSTSLIVTLDRIAPEPEQSIILRSAMYLSTSTQTSYVHHFSSKNPALDESNAEVIVHRDHHPDFPTAPSSSIALGESAVLAKGDNAIIDDFSYEVEYIDAAGNSSGRVPLRDTSKPPELISYTIDVADDTYVVVGEPIAGSSIAAVRQYALQTGDKCDPTDTASTKTPFTDLGTVATYTTDICVEAEDDTGATTDFRNLRTIRVKEDAEAQLISSSGVHPDDDDGRLNDDSVTNNPNPRYVGAALPETEVRIESRLGGGAGSWNSVGGTVSTDAQGAFTIAAILSSPLTVDGEVEIRGYISGGVLGQTEIGPITLTAVTIDVTAPVAPTGISFADTAQDAGSSSSDGITNVSQDLEIDVLGEDKGMVFLYDSGVAISDGRIVSSGGVTFKVNFSTEGAHILTAILEDVAGNRSPVSAPYTITIDTTLPTTSVLVLNDSDPTDTDVDIDADTRFIGVFTDSGSAVAETHVDEEGESACSARTDSTSADTYTPNTIYPTGTVTTPTTSGYCFMATDTAGNFVAAHTDSAIAGIGNLLIDGATTYAGSTTYYLKPGSRTVTGITAPSSKVLIKLAGRTEDPSSYTDAQLQDPSFATFTEDVSASATTFSHTRRFSTSDTDLQIIGWIWTDDTDSTTATPAVSLGFLAVDGQAPSITFNTLESDNTNTSFAKEGDSLELLFTVDELLLSDPVVTIAGETATKVAFSGNTYTYIVALTSQAEEGNAQSVVTFVDRAGNSTTKTLSSSVAVDSRAPQVTYQKTPNRNFLSPTSSPQISLTIKMTDMSGIAGESYRFVVAINSSSSGDDCVVTVPSGNPTVATGTCSVLLDGTYVESDTITVGPAVSLIDVPGNTVLPPAEILYHFDTAAPVVNSIAEPNVSAKKRVAFSINASHNQTPADQGILESLTPVFTDACSEFQASPADLSSDADQDPVTYSFSVSGISGTFSNCGLLLRDEAGNESPSFSVQDFTVKKGGGGGRAGTSPTFGGISDFFSAPEPERSTLTRDLSIGSQGSDVRALQQFLNQAGYLVASSGPGSRGSETDYFGELTRQALARYQEDNGLVPATGYFGIATRAFVAADQVILPPVQQPAGQVEVPTLVVPVVPDAEQVEVPTLVVPVVPEVQAPPVETSSTFSYTRNLAVGSQGSDVRALQQFLNQAGYLVASSGPGSRGSETDYFGELTRQALARYQEDNGLVPATGYFGIATRAFVAADQVILSPVYVHQVSDLNPPAQQPVEQDFQTRDAGSTGSYIEDYVYENTNFHRDFIRGDSAPTSF